MWFMWHSLEEFRQFQNYADNYFGLPSDRANTVATPVAVGTETRALIDLDRYTDADTLPGIGLPCDSPPSPMLPV